MTKQKTTLWILSCNSAISLFYAALLMTGILTIPSAARAADSNVYQAQGILKGLSYEPGPADGLMGAKTREAIKQYQKDRQLPQTGQLDEKTANSLGVKPLPQAKAVSNVAPRGCVSKCLKKADGSCSDLRVLECSNPRRCVIQSVLTADGTASLRRVCR
jgi:peptidoglycan hydrolase-like protein with peptidoglycan-binding domain